MNWVRIQLFSIMVFIGSIFPGNKSIDLGNDYALKDKTIIPKNLYTNTEIYARIVEYKFDEKYIIAQQRPKISSYKKLLERNLVTRLMIYDGFLKERNDKAYEESTTPEIIQEIKSDSLLYYQFKKKGLKENYYDKSLNTKIVVDSILQNNPFYKKIFASKVNYWIINKLGNKRFGPYTKIEFENQLELRNINLKFE